jgi:hypothetical protein
MITMQLLFFLWSCLPGYWCSALVLWQSAEFGHSPFWSSIVSDAGALLACPSIQTANVYGLNVLIAIDWGTQQPGVSAAYTSNQ